MDIDDLTRDKRSRRNVYMYIYVFQVWNGWFFADLRYTFIDSNAYDFKRSPMHFPIRKREVTDCFL